MSMNWPWKKGKACQEYNILYRYTMQDNHDVLMKTVKKQTNYYL